MGFMKYAVEMGSGGVIYMTGFVKILFRYSEFWGGGYGDLVSLLSFLSRLKHSQYKTLLMIQRYLIYEPTDHEDYGR
jgi:hypothetical protein